MKKCLLISFVALLPACSWLQSHPAVEADLQKMEQDAVQTAEDALARRAESPVKQPAVPAAK